MTWAAAVARSPVAAGRPRGWLQPMEPWERSRLYRAAQCGDIPAEALPPREADQLMRHLMRIGLTDLEIAEHTRWSTYTVSRKRARLQLK